MIPTDFTVQTTGGRASAIDALASSGSALELSALTPAFNEVDDVEPLDRELDAVVCPSGRRYELLFDDDGSTDGTAEKLDAILRMDTVRPGRAAAT
jgi:hypothetical protein